MTKLVYGIGTYRKGKYQSSDPSYKIWTSMLSRCVPNGTIQTKSPCYVGCTVHPDWVEFQKFADWCQYQIGYACEDYQLDKDILSQGNKVYGPDTCRFVPSKLNRLLTNTKRNMGKYPTGVSLNSDGKFRAQIGVGNQVKYLGVFTTVNEALIAYNTAKRLAVRSLVETYRYEIDDLVYKTLMSM